MVSCLVCMRLSCFRFPSTILLAYMEYTYIMAMAAVKFYLFWSSSIYFLSSFLPDWLTENRLYLLFPVLRVALTKFNFPNNRTHSLCEALCLHGKLKQSFAEGYDSCCTDCGETCRTGVTLLQFSIGHNALTNQLLALYFQIRIKEERK